ncbi:MAG: hypothetical protein JWR20_2287 [Marmoricola sp.]|nr:hypothetical protein [Marmoricola sp.]
MSTEQQRHRAREAALSGPPGAAGPSPRTTIAASWRRVAACGLEPGSTPDVPPLAEAELARRRASSELAEFVPRLTRTLSSVVDAGQLVVVAGADGRVLWRVGSPGVRRMADGLGFVGGSAWTEGNVGTNAIGTSLVLGAGVHIRGPEHFVESHTRWGCAAAPLRDPWSGRTLGVVDVSGPSRGMHPAELALVETAARLTAMELLERRRGELDRLRARVAPLLAGITGEALAVDLHGHLAAGVGARLPDRVALPDDLAGGPVWLPTLGAATAEPLAGGWLLRLDSGDDPARDGAGATLVLDLTGSPCLRVGGASGGWSRRLTPRHAEILLALVGAGPAGRSASALAEDLFDDDTRVVTVRAEMSRLRRALGSLLLSGPYRLAPTVAASLELPLDVRGVLPGSSAPVVRRLVERG